MALADTISALLPGRIAANPYIPSGPVLASPSLSTVDTTPVSAPVISAPTAIAPAIRSAVSLAPQLQSAVAERDRLQNSGSGISQVQNKYARAGLTALDTIARIGGSVFAPLNVLEHELPGTSGHHDVLVHRADQRIANEQAQQGAQLQQEDEQAQVTQRQALAQQEQAKAQALLHPQAKPTAELKPVSLQQSYADAVTDAMSRGVDPSKDPHVQQLADAQTALQRVPTSKDPNKDDKYIAIQSKPRAQWTPEEAAFVKGYDQFVEKNKIQPAGVRAQVQLQLPQAVVDPNDPTREIYVTRKQALGMEATGSGEAAAARGTVKDFASGKDAHTLNAFNAAQYHLQTLAKAASALKNGDVTAFNQLSQAYAQATGSAAPTNFDAVKLAVRGEVARALSGNATVAEQSDLEKNFSRASSPAQLIGIASTYHELLEGKKQALRSQYEAGTKGKPDFGGNGGRPPAGSRVRDYTQVKK